LVTFAALMVSLVPFAEPWPALPESDGEVLLPAQEWPRQPGPRTIKTFIRYPGGSLDNVNPETGLMLSLHCWGCEGWGATADPSALANRYNVVGISVDYLQSGDYDPATHPLPYDHGYLQALDALRALFHVYNGLDELGKPFDKRRIYAVGGSGGGNVSLMANKLAPRTFAAIVEMCGMAKLNDDVAFGMPGGSKASACYTRDPESPRYLSPDAQALRDLGHMEHLKVMKALGNTTRVISIHGPTDDLISPEEKRSLIDRMVEAKLNSELHWITDNEVDGEALRSTGHMLGDWTAIVFRFGDAAFTPGSPQIALRAGATDFERRDDNVAYATPNGTYRISYVEGYPVGRFETK
jgi:predicted esterase